ncbi:hypothetical protein MNBD_GAMMA10-538 [hydrothermal vent metagenome]|uniref:Uncharacterized protein n=1 Tax=hydrothermal vent metagenome TaxID=652676 RepID=A0A3B0Y477_9ZZZZ
MSRKGNCLPSRHEIFRKNDCAALKVFDSFLSISVVIVTLFNFRP